MENKKDFKDFLNFIYIYNGYCIQEEMLKEIAPSSAVYRVCENNLKYRKERLKKFNNMDQFYYDYFKKRYKNLILNFIIDYIKFGLSAKKTQIEISEEEIKTALNLKDIVFDRKYIIRIFKELGFEYNEITKEFFIETD